MSSTVLQPYQIQPGIPLQLRARKPSEATISDVSGDLLFNETFTDYQDHGLQLADDFEDLLR